MSVDTGGGISQACMHMKFKVFRQRGITSWPRATAASAADGRCFPTLMRAEGLVLSAAVEICADFDLLCRLMTEK